MTAISELKKQKDQNTKDKDKKESVVMSGQFHTLVMFSSRDRDNDKHGGENCAIYFTGGWWYNACTRAHLTGLHTDFRTTIDTYKQIRWHDGGDRGESYDSRKEATIMLVPKGEY